jgi:hypothetical protein
MQRFLDESSGNYAGLQGRRASACGGASNYLYDDALARARRPLEYVFRWACCKGAFFLCMTWFFFILHGHTSPDVVLCQAVTPSATCLLF